MTDNRSIFVPAKAALKRTEQLLTGAGLKQAPAAIAARVLVDADRRGHHSHGLSLLPLYLERIRLGGFAPTQNLDG